MRFPRELVIRAFIQTCDTAHDDGRQYAVVPEECLQELEPGEHLPVRLDLCGSRGRSEILNVNFICLKDALHPDQCGYERDDVEQYAL